MNCPNCRHPMIRVGREIKPGHPEIWAEGFLCPTRRCPGYGALDYENRQSVWPAMTLADTYLHAMIRGAMHFRDGQK